MIIAFQSSFLLIDAHNFFIRHYAANPSLDTNGERNGGVVGMIRGLRNLAERLKPTAIIVVWDGHGGSAKRRSIRAEYKSGRRVRLNRGQDGDADFSETAKEDLHNMDDQMELAKKYVEILGIQQIVPDGCEADDMISYLTTVLDGRKIIISTDRDFLQLVTKDVNVYNPIKERLYTPKEVMEDVGCTAANYVLMKSVCGDKGDDVSGVEGVGPKTLMKLVPSLAGEDMQLPQVFERLTELSTQADKKGKPTATARQALKIIEKHDHIVENLSLVSLHTPLIDAGSARAARSKVLSPPQYRTSSIRMEAMKDGIQLKEDFDKPFIMLATRTSMWAKSKKEADQMETETNEPS